MLTVKAIEKLPRPTKPTLVPDGRSLYLRISPNGNKSWVYRYRVGAKVREMGLGAYPGVGLAEARRKAEQCRTDRANGIDPIEVKNAEKVRQAAVPTFGEFAAEYLERRKAKWKASSTKHVAEWERTIARLSFKDMPIDRVDTQAILRAIKAWAGKHKSQMDVIDRIRMVLDAAGAAGHRDPSIPNPARWRGHLEHLVEHKPRSDNHHAAMPYEELPAFMTELRSQVGVDYRALEFAILTAARSAEVIGATWQEIDFKRRLWVIPGDRMKGGQQHEVPLSSAALAILQGVDRRHELVFAGLHPQSLRDCLQRKMGSEFTAHGFRSTFSMWCQEMDVPRDLREMALAHAEGDKVAAAYARSKLIELRHGLMERWATFCAGTVIELRSVS
jgi:integrase